MPFKDPDVRRRKARGYCKKYRESHDNAGYMAGWREREREKHQGAERRTKRDALNLLGGCQCVGCGEEDISVLTVDHIHSDGAARRLAGEGHGTGLYYNLINGRASLDGLRVLCANCQLRARMFGPETTNWVDEATLYELDSWYEVNRRG